MTGGCRTSAWTRTGHQRAAGTALAVCVLLAACQPTERVVSYKPFFAGLPGVQTQTPAVVHRGDMPAAAPDDGRIVIEHPDGSVTLVARSARHLIAHIQRTLRNNEVDLFVEQVLSEQTRREFLLRGLDPREAFDRLKRDEAALGRLFARMPMGEHSPHVVMRKLDRRLYRVQLTGAAARGLEIYGFDMALENGNWRLVWVLR